MSFIPRRGTLSRRLLSAGVVAAAIAGLLAPQPAAAVAGGLASAPPLHCVDNGTSGNRIQFVYAYEPGTSRFAEREAEMRAAAWIFEQNVNDSARREGAQRWAKLLTTSTGCQLLVNAVQVPAGSTNTGNWLPTLRNLGYNSGTRIYVILSENHRANCAGTESDNIGNDDSPGTGNLHNSRATWITFQPSCFTGHSVTHEIGHALGGLMPNAPHFYGGGHCSDGYEPVCQDESGSVTCTDPLAVRLYDCGRDDYFAINPVGSYLQTHWNAALHSLYLQAGSSVPAMTTIPPLAPQFLRATDVEGTSIAFSWVPSTAPAGSGWTIEFQLLRNGSVVATLPSWKAAVRLTGLAANTTATYTVRERFTYQGVTRTSAASPALTVTTNSSTATAGAVENNATMIFTNDVLDAPGRNLALDLFSFSEDENASVVQWPQNTAVNQRWGLSSTDGGVSYQIRSKHSTKCLTPLAGGTTAGTPVVQATCAGTTAQRWKFTSIGTATYQIKPASSNLCVQAQNAGTGGGVPLVLAACSTAQPTQRWSTTRTA